MADESDTFSEPDTFNEDVSSLASSVTTNDSAYGSSGAENQPPTPKVKKRVCFEAEESLVKVFEIPYDNVDSPLPEELEPCDPFTLVQKFEDLTLKSVLTTKYGSYTLPRKESRITDQIVASLTTDVQSTVSSRDNESSLTEVNTTKTVRIGRQHRKVEKGDISKQNSKRELPPDPVVIAAGDCKGGSSVHHRRRKKPTGGPLSRQGNRRDKNSNSFPHSSSRKSEKTLNSVQGLLQFKSPKDRCFQKSHSSDSIVSIDKQRPKSCTALPTLHLSPYKRAKNTCTDYTLCAKPITFPDFISRGSGRTTDTNKTESASWAKMSFISKDSSPPAERNDSGSSSASNKQYSWKVANGMIKPVDTMTSITPMWENLTSKPLTPEANSVLSAL